MSSGQGSNSFFDPSRFKEAAQANAVTNTPGQGINSLFDPIRFAATAQANAVTNTPGQAINRLFDPSLFNAPPKAPAQVNAVMPNQAINRLFDPNQLRSLTPSQANAVMPNQAINSLFDPSRFKEATQVNALTPTQVNSINSTSNMLDFTRVTPNQVSSVIPNQVNVPMKTQVQVSNTIFPTEKKTNTIVSSGQGNNIMAILSRHGQLPPGGLGGVLGVKEEEISKFVQNIDKLPSSLNVEDLDNRINVLEKVIEYLNLTLKNPNRNGIFIFRTVNLILADSKSRRNKFADLSATKEGFVNLVDSPKAKDLWRTVMVHMGLWGVKEQEFIDVINNFEKSPTQMTKEQQLSRFKILQLLKQISYLFNHHELLLRTAQDVTDSREILNRNSQALASIETERKQIAALASWQKRKAASIEAQSSWENRKREIFNGNQEIKDTKNGGCISYDWWCSKDYGNDWQDNGNVNRGFCNQRRSCRKTDAARWQQAEQQVIRERGNSPGNFNEAQPVVTKALAAPTVPGYVKLLHDSQGVELVKAGHAIINYLLDLYLEELYMVLSPQEIRIGLPFEKFAEFYKILEQDGSIIQTRIANLETEIKAKNQEINVLRFGQQDYINQLQAAKNETNKMLDFHKQFRSEVESRMSKAEADYLSKLQLIESTAQKNMQSDLQVFKADHAILLAQKQTEKVNEINAITSRMDEMKSKFEGAKKILDNELESKNMEIKRIGTESTTMRDDYQKRVDKLTSDLTEMTTKYEDTNKNLSGKLLQKQLEHAAVVAEMDNVTAQNKSEKALLQQTLESDAREKIAAVQTDLQSEIDKLMIVKAQYEELQEEVKKQKRELAKMQSVETHNQTLSMAIEGNKSTITYIVIALVVAIVIIIILISLLRSR